MVQATDHNGHVTLTQYDDFNRPVFTRRRMGVPTVNSALDIVTESTYNNLGLLTSEKDANGTITSHEYDALLRKIRSTTTVTVPDPGAAPPQTDEHTSQRCITVPMRARARSRSAGSIRRAS